MELLTGTSGWHYRHWRGDFYPPTLASSRWLECYASAFATVEINSSFYRLTPAATMRSWRDSVPDDFVFAMKASRYLTHVRRLRDPQGPVELIVERSGELGAKRGPILLQLPPDLGVDLDRLHDTLAAFGPGVQVAVEVRHDSWDTPGTAELLRAHGAALCLADRRGALRPRWATAEWGYVRFHAGRSRAAPCYGTKALATWASRVRGMWPQGEVFAYFNNDQAGCAPRDASTFTRLASTAVTSDGAQK